MNTPQQVSEGFVFSKSQFPHVRFLKVLFSADRVSPLITYTIFIATYGSYFTDSAY